MGQFPKLGLDTYFFNIYGIVHDFNPAFVCSLQEDVDID